MSCRRMGNAFTIELNLADPEFYKVKLSVFIRPTRVIRVPIITFIFSTQNNHT